MSAPEPFPADEVRPLLAAARAGDRAALGRVMETFRAYLLAVADGELAAAVRPKAHPSDVVQDAFLEAYRAFERFGGAEPAQFRAWLRGILLNKVADAHKRYLAAKREPDRERPLDGDVLAGPDGTPSATASRGEEALRVAAALARLGETDQKVIAWRTWDGAAFAEIGRRLGRSEDAARMLFARALERFQAELEHADDGP